MDYRCIAINPVPNVYSRLGLDPSENDLDARVLEVDGALEQMGLSADRSPRTQLAVAWKIVSDPECRRLYDDWLLNKPVSWDDLEYLASFGSLPPRVVDGQFGGSTSGSVGTAASPSPGTPVFANRAGTTAYAGDNARDNAVTDPFINPYERLGGAQPSDTQGSDNPYKPYKSNANTLFSLGESMDKVKLAWSTGFPNGKGLGQIGHDAQLGQFSYQSTSLVPMQQGCPASYSANYLANYSDYARYGHMFGYPPESYPLRATAFIRIAMGLLDRLLVSLIASVGLVMMVAGFDEGHVLAGIAGSALMLIGPLAYYVVPEALSGATPAKKLFGYTVRDAETQQKLTLEASLKRNWWKLLMMCPGVGPFIALATATSVTKGRGRIAPHDERVHAEVVKDVPQSRELF